MISQNMLIFALLNGSSRVDWTQRQNESINADMMYLKKYAIDTSDINNIKRDLDPVINNKSKSRMLKKIRVDSEHWSSGNCKMKKYDTVLHEVTLHEQNLIFIINHCYLLNKLQFNPCTRRNKTGKFVLVHFIVSASSVLAKPCPLLVLCYCVRFGGLLCFLKQNYL